MDALIHKNGKYNKLYKLIKEKHHILISTDALKNICYVEDWYLNNFRSSTNDQCQMKVRPQYKIQNSETVNRHNRGQ